MKKQFKSAAFAALAAVMVTVSACDQTQSALSNAGSSPEASSQAPMPPNASSGSISLNKDKKDATPRTAEHNRRVEEGINRESIAVEAALAKKGLIAEKKSLVIPRADGKGLVWDMTNYDFLQGKAPDTVNPKLWEHAKLNMNIGLYRVTDNIYQVRGFDLANITFINGKTGYIVIDPLTAQETAAAAYSFIKEQLGDKPVSAVIFTHSHVDHFAGVNGVVDQNAAVKPVVYAPDGFMDAVVQENLFAGSAMNRRSFYMLGAILARGAKGQVDGGLGKYAANGTQGLLAPDVTITNSTETMLVDGVEMVFQLTNGTEAPSEMNVYIPSEQSLCIAENCTATLHNLYTLRGAEVRDPEKWADYLDQTVKLFGAEMQSVFSTHNWPRFGNAESIDYLQSQRDCYQYIKDQTLRLMGQGHTLDEVGRMVALPKSLTDRFFNGEFYGTVSHNAKAVYQKYLGWYDSNPVNLNKLLPEDSAVKYVAYMGGSEEILKNAAADFEKGEYQWVAEVTKQVIFAEPDNTKAKLLCADALEQLGYISESALWRNEYLFGAEELRNGINMPFAKIVFKPEVYSAMDMSQLAAMIAIRLNGEAADGKNLIFTIETTDGDKKGSFHLRNGVLAYLGEDTAAQASFTVKMPTVSLYMLASGAGDDPTYTVEPAEKQAEFDALVKMLDTANNQFAIVTP